MNRGEFHHDLEAGSKNGRARTTKVLGTGLHTGASASVSLSHAGESAVMLRADDGAYVPVSACFAAEAERSSRIYLADRTTSVRTVEHLFAALGGLGIHAKLRVDVRGGEVPLACGSARTFVEALQRIGACGDPERDASLFVRRAGHFEIGESWYRFAPASRVSVGVTLHWPYAYLPTRAVWRGSVEDFVQRIAPARTFGLEHEATALIERGLARFVDPESVVLVTAGGLLSQGPAPEPDEPARHKLLDLIGDLFLHGGPPRGAVEAHRPSHAHTHEAVRRAVRCGVLARGPA